MYCTIPYYTKQNISCDRSNTKLDRIIWHTTFWGQFFVRRAGSIPPYAALLPKNPLHVTIKYNTIQYKGWEYIHSILGPSYLFEGLGVYRLMQHFLSAHSPSGGLIQRVGNLCMCMCLCGSAVISSSSSSPSSVEEGSSQACVGAVPRELSLYYIMSSIRWRSSTVTQCAVLFSL